MTTRRNAPETGLERVMREYEEGIRAAMAKRLWVGAFANYADEDGRDDPAIAQYRPPPGGDWYDYAPETPDAADKAAAELAEMYGQWNGGDKRFPMAEAMAKAMFVDIGGGFWEFSFEDRLELSDAKRDAHDALIAEFGSGMAAYALGEGANWFSDHKRFAEMPSIVFECHYDGEELTWSGRLMSSGDSGYVGRHDKRESPGLGDKIGRITVVNPNDRSWTRHRYMLAFGAYGDTLLLCYANSLDEALDEAIDWLVEHAPGHIIDEQVAEAYNAAIAEGLSEDAAREQAEEDATSGGNHGNYISSAEWTAVAEDPTEEQLHEIGHVEPRARVAGQHPTYAGSRIGLVHVANPRQQVHSAHGYLFRFPGRGNALILAYGDDQDDAATEAIDWAQQRLGDSVTGPDADAHELVEVDPSRETLRTIGAEHVNPSRRSAARRRR